MVAKYLWRDIGGQASLWDTTEDTITGDWGEVPCYKLPSSLGDVWLKSHASLTQPPECWVGVLRDEANDYNLSANFLSRREHLLEWTIKWRKLCTFGCCLFPQCVIFQTVGHFSILSGRLVSCDFHLSLWVNVGHWKKVMVTWRYLAYNVIHAMCASDWSCMS